MSDDSPFVLQQGSVPLLISLPHVGTRIPQPLQAAYLPRALDTEDTDWHLERLYRPIAEALGASLLVPEFSRYVIDLNRPPEDTPMYPGAANTELCPTRFFTGDPLYREGQAPDPAECARRRLAYWQPYHDALADELARLRRRHGVALLFDGHSIRSEVPWLFPGRLPDLNLGTANGASCDPGLREVLAEVLASAPGYSSVVDGRFRGGYITRNYGRPAQGCHAVQLEMCQCAYMQEDAPFAYDAAAAARVRPVIERLLARLLAWSAQ